MLEAPRAFNRKIYHDNKSMVFYGTDDGSQDGSFGEYPAFIEHYEQADSSRKENIHMISVVGGLYGLNLIPLWKPKKLTIFDINPIAVTYFKVIRRVWISSNSAAHFLDQLAKAEYDVKNEDEAFIRENIRLKSADQLPRSRGSSKRTFAESWTMALKHFDVTKKVLAEAELDIRLEPMESESFSKMINESSNLWVYASNITEFHFFDLEVQDPSNMVALQIIFPGQPQLLDLADFGKNPVKVNFHIPLSAELL